MGNIKNLVGNRYGRLTIISHAGSDKYRNATFNAICDCGNTIVVASHAVQAGRVQSCGCLKTDMLKARRKRSIEYGPKRRVGRPTEFFQEDIDRVIALYNEGYSYRGIQQFVNAGLRTLSRIINDNQDKLTRGQYVGGNHRNGD